MASEFVRKVKGIRNIDILSPNITTENDLISTIDGEVYVATNKGYRKITGVETKEITGVETKGISQIKTDLSNLKNQSDNNGSKIRTLTTSTANNTSEIETLKTLTANNISEIETLETKIETLETINNGKVLLFDGSAGDTDDLIKLNQSYKDFTELKIKVSRTGGNEIFIFDGEVDGTISINHTNLFNSGSGYSVNEMLIRKNSSTEFEIYYQGYFDSNGTSNNESGITILKIWGVK